MKIKVTCPFCKKEREIEVDKTKYKRWQNGEFAQNVWPELTPDEREAIITGTCQACWDGYFG